MRFDLFAAHDSPDTVPVTQEELKHLSKQIAAAIIAINIVLKDAGVLKSATQFEEAMKRAFEALGDRP